MTVSKKTLNLSLLLFSFLAVLVVEDLFAQGPRTDREQRFPATRRFYEELLEKNAQNAEAHYYLGVDHLREPQDPEKAVEHLERAVELDEGNAEYHYMLAEAYLADFTYASIFRKPFIAAKVKDQLEKTVRYDPSSIRYREALIEYYVFAPTIFGGSTGKATEHANAIAAIDPYLGVLAHASISAENGETDKAMMLYRKAIKMSPAGWQAYQRFGNYYLDVRQFDEAIVMFKRLVEIAPNNAGSYEQLGRAYERKRMYDQAIEAFHQAFQKDASLGHLVFRIAQLYEFKGDKSSAVRYYQKYLTLVSSGRAAEDARTKIRDLSS